MPEHERISPPFLGEKILKWFFSPHETEALLGDFEEIYLDLFFSKGRARARFWYWTQIILLFPPFLKDSIFWSKEMVKNYLKVALRNIKKSKIYSFVNVLGLSVGMACCFLIFLYIQHELSYDRFHEKSDRIYRITTEWQIEGQAQIHETAAAPIAPALLNDFPGVHEAVRMRRTGAVLNHNSKSFVESRVYLVDPSFFDVFNFPLIQGNPDTALKRIHSIVLTEKTVEKYFRNENPIGKTLTFENRFDLEVTGIAQNAPSNSYIDFDFLIPFGAINSFSNYNYLESWSSWNFQTYLLLQKDFSPSELEEKSSAFIKKYRGQDSTNPQRFHLQPLTKINLETSGKLKYIYFFSAIAAIILILACINFMNLSIARSSTRVREIGMRKVIGAYRHQLVKQFLGESIVLAFVALPLAILFAHVTLPAFNALLKTQLKSDYFQNFPFLVGILGITLLVSLISGSYPALYLSGFQPVRSMRGELKSGARVTRFRSLLVVFQFATSIILIICTLAVHHQMRFIHNRNLGFNKDFVVNVPLYDSALRQKTEYIKHELLANPDILSVTSSSFSPGSYPNQSVDWEGRKEDEELMMAWYSVDYDFIRTYEMEIIEGRDFSKESPSDIQSAYVLNEAAVKAFGWEYAVGQGFMVEKAGFSMGTVVGVMKDFHFASLHQDIKPLALVLEPEGGYQLSLKISSKSMNPTLSFIEKKFKEFAPSAPFSYSFVDDEIAEMYMEEERLGKLINSFSVIAILIACLGLLGLASFAINRRIKEIGIRKVLGASVPAIIILLSKDFTSLVVVANVIAWPVAYYGMNRWLQNFAYRIGLSWWLFVLSALLALLTALLTIGFHAIKAALANPVNFLRYE
jgi:putative ABC transport system permease protein